MQIAQSRRRFLTTLSLAGAASLLRLPRAQAAEDALETIAAVGQGGDLLAACGLLCLQRHRRKLVAVTSWATIRWCSASTAICTL